MQISRKTLLKGIALGTISLPLFLRGLLNENQAQQPAENFSDGKKYKWKMVTTWPPNFPILGESCQILADIIEEMSGGRIEIKVYGGGELVPPLECFDAVRSGAAEVAGSCAYYWAGKVPAAQFFASVPFGMNAQQMNAWILCGGGLEKWQELYSAYNLVPFPAGNTGVQMGGWFNKEINSLDDLKGLKMRIPGLGGKVLEKAGGAPVLLAGGEIFTGLERGVIDATEWIGPFHDYHMGFHQIARYYYAPGWHELGTELEFMFNKEQFDQLPNDLQKIIEHACKSVNAWVLSEMEAMNSQYMDKLQAENVDIRTFPEDVLNQLRVYTEESIADLVDTDPFAREVYASYSDFKKKSASWSKWTEKVFYERIQEEI